MFSRLCLLLSPMRWPTIKSGYCQDYKKSSLQRGEAGSSVKCSCFSGQVFGLAKMHLVCVHAAFRVSALPKYAMSGVCLSRAV